MQNDVVRWSSSACNSYSVTNNHSFANNNKLYRKIGHQSRFHKSKQYQNVEKATSHNIDLLPTIAFKESNNQSVKCDINVYDLYLVQNVVNSCRYIKNYKNHNCFHQQFDCGKGSRRSYSNSYGNTLLFLLQLSLLIILCSLNVGFVTSANVEEKSPCRSDPLKNEKSANYIGGHYTRTWAVHIPDGDKDGKVEIVAKDHGFINLGKIFNDHYHFAHPKVSKRALTAALSHQNKLDEDDRVSSAKQQIAKSRRKRDFIHMRPSRTSSVSAVSLVPFNDPKWPQMWYLNRGGDLDMNVIRAWKDGITGKGIVVTILDDGLEIDHPDLISNYDPKASYDVNSHDPDPMPQYDLTDSNRHGTRCAGEVAATANNSNCAVGIAFGASVGGVRMLDGDVTDAVEARSLSLNPQHIDIYSASWGPDDDGKTVDGPGEFASRAFIDGVTKGRNGKGSIFIWASGNGGRELDNCNCDGYTNSIWTLSISSATEEGHVPWYSEKCSSTLATTYSSGSQTEKQVVTTDLHHSCTVSHTGTSASAPLAAGIAALVLESNTNLTWRDLQHIVVRTAKPANLIDPKWSRNGVGRRVSHSFGYGLMDAFAMVRLARNWKTVPEQQRCEIKSPHIDKTIPSKGHITLQLSVKNCLNINFLEHVQANVTLTSQRRGDIQINLISAAGTNVTLLTPRVHDTSHSGFNQWPFMSVHTWGESPHGNWQLEIHNEGRFMGHALLREWSLIFYGTTQPIHPNDPISTARTTLVNITTPNSSSTGNNLHQVYSAQYPRMSNNNVNFSKLALAGKLYSSKLPINKSVYVAGNSDIRNDPLFKAINQGSVNKKQQQQPSKNTKLNKNKGKSQESNKSSKNSYNNGRPLKQKETTTQVTLISQKNKFYRISQQIKIQNSSELNLKQKVNKLQKSSERLHSSEDKINRKVIGDLQSSSSSTVGSIGKLNAKSASLSAKMAGKATKQIKESVSTKKPLLTTDILIPIRGGTFAIQPNQKITKLFERYEKIQSIFPELQPYQPILKDKNDIAAVFKNTTKNKHLVIESNISAGGTAIVKPLRENSKKSSPSFVPDKKNLKKQQLLLAAAGVDGTQNSAVAITTSNKKISNAQITQWDLIFYGTATPAQPDDPTPTNSKQYSSFRNEMIHNDIDYEPSEQWNNVEQMGKPSMRTHDRTNTSCVKTTINQQCLACAPPTFFYKGRCYDVCPIRTYAFNHTGNTEEFKNAEINQAINLQDDEELQSIDRKKRSKHLYRIINELSEYNQNTADFQSEYIKTMSCEPCDKSCLRCYGPLNSQCNICPFGSQLKRMAHTNETYCMNFSERSSGNAFENISTRAFAGNLFLLILVPFIIIIALALFYVIFRKRKCLLNCSRKHIDSDLNSAFSYDRVALFADEDNEEEEIDFLNSYPPTIEI